LQVRKKSTLLMWNPNRTAPGVVGKETMT
jgi:hypothetical protein